MSRVPLRALIIGSPGSGKGTLSARLAKTAPALRTLSAGDVLRAQIRARTPIGLQAEKVVSKGGLMPDEVMMGVLSSEVEGLGTSPWMLDGFPRTLGQAKLLDAKLVQLSQPLNLVLNLNVPAEVVLARILDRWVHPASGRVYNTTFNPPLKAGLDDITGEPLEQRTDDNAESFASRLQAFHRETAPLLAYYREASGPHAPAYVNIDGTTSEEIWPHLEEAVSQFGLQ